MRNVFIQSPLSHGFNKCTNNGTLIFIVPVYLWYDEREDDNDTFSERKGDTAYG